MNEYAETEFQKQIFDLARVTGWVWWHFHDSRRSAMDPRTGQTVFFGDTSARGFPDLVLAGRGAVLHRELKTDKGTVELAQLKAVLAIHDNGGNADVWRPRDWALIERTLTSKRPAGIDLAERIAALRKGYEARSIRAAIRGG